MKLLLSITLITLASCRDLSPDPVNTRRDSIDHALDTMLLKATELNNKLRDCNEYLRLAAPHQEKSIAHLRKYYATYNDRYLRLYNLHNDSFRYYLNKSIGK